MNCCRMCLAFLALMLLGCSTDTNTAPPPAATTPSNEPASAPVSQPVNEPVDDETLLELSQLLRDREQSGELSDENRQRIEEIIQLLLPNQGYIGEGREWSVNCSPNLVTLELRRKDDDQRLIWFHVVYHQEPPDDYGSEDFGAYRGMGMTDVHYFILVGSLEIRAVAHAEEYKDDAKIKDMLRAFSLADIEKL